MGVYSDYLSQQLSFEQLTAERKKQLKRISAIRSRSVVVFSSDVAKNCPNGIDYSDIVPYSDQLSAASGSEVDIILETPGGFAEVVEDLVKLTRGKFNKVGVIVPGMAKSAGTIFAMAADEILMGATSALGPIDAQIESKGKRFSADAFLAGLDEIQKKAEQDKHLNIAYIPILQNLSPGEIQHCVHAQALSQSLVTNWLKEYKFKFWTKHSSSGHEVTDGEKKEKAESIARTLCNQRLWLTHNRSIKIADLTEMGLQITDYSVDNELNDAITRYYTLLRMSFETNIYKIYETSETQIYRSMNAAPPPAIMPQSNVPNMLFANIICSKCSATIKVQINLDNDYPVQPEAILFPQNNLLKCPQCGAESDLLGLRQQIEADTKKRVR